MRGKRYTEEFKIESVKQVTDRGYSVNDVSKRLGVTSKSLYGWVKRYGNESERYQTEKNQEDEIRRLKRELKRVTEERDILKKAAEYFAKESG